MSRPERRPALTIDDLPIDAPFVGSTVRGTDWLTTAQRDRWRGAVLQWEENLYTLHCRPHSEVIGRVCRLTIIGYGEDVPLAEVERVERALALEGALGLPASGETREAARGHLQARTIVNKRAEARGLRGRRSRAQAQMRWAKGVTYTALLNDPGLPLSLPLACPQCGRVDVGRDLLVEWADREDGIVHRVVSVPRR